MKVSHGIVGLVSDFAALNRSPDVRVVPATSPSRKSSQAQMQQPQVRKTSVVSPFQLDRQDDGGGRRHSIKIAVGVDEVPVCPADGAAKTDQPVCAIDDHPNFLKSNQCRRQSAPCISQVASSTSLRERLLRAKARDRSVDLDDNQIGGESKDRLKAGASASYLLL